MNAKWKTPKAARRRQVLLATAACLMILSCASPEGFNVPLAADPASPHDGGVDSKTSGSGGSVVGLDGRGTADAIGMEAGTGGGAGPRGGGAGQAGAMGAPSGQAGGGTGGGAGRPDGSETTGSGGSVSSTGPGGMAGAAVGQSGSASGGSGGSASGATGGSATGGSATGGSATGGSATGGSATSGSATGGSGGRSGVGGAGGSPQATGPCAGLCTNPTVISLPHAATDLGSNATCQEAMGSIEGGNCGNFVSPRTFKVNGVTVPCTTSNWTTVPPLRNGGYCFQANAGSHSYAYFVTF